MRRYLLVAVVTTVVAVTGSAAAGGVRAGAAVQAGRDAAGSQLWTARIQFQTGKAHFSDAVAVSPHGRTVFVTSEGYLGRAAGAGYQTMAFRAATGKRLWASRYHGPTKGGDTPKAMAVSPSGTTVFVTGSSPSRGAGKDYATVAYRASTGKQLWASRYSGQANGDDRAEAVAVSPDGKTVYVTGTGSAGRTGFDYATVAYNATTGKQLWASRYGPGIFGGAESVAVSPDGGRVFVTGTISPRNSDSVYVTLAYSATTGKQLWTSRYHGPGETLNDANSVAVSQKGTKVFVTGTSGFTFATVAYNAANGKQLWTRRFHGAQEGAKVFVAVNPAGTTVFISGMAHGEYTTVACSAATGKQRWASRHAGYEIHSQAVSPRGTAVYVTGYGRSQTGYDTVAYSAATGRQLWTGRDHGPGIGFGSGDSIVASPDGRTVFVSGWTQISAGPTRSEYLIIAFRS